ncbi:MAG TPA: DUF3857 domain-containing protein [Ideonella sp.]|uniref:DUF3857 domain-containing protein n=1 Tax=Ideonella sp. TaxID=1929293 RepID=UPI002C8AA9C4|nr:DUF3857 domain-containing protein [Ideonella sp.]HSI47811.1 DUF3857 domain-containing protein [Ideonella sp.]
MPHAVNASLHSKPRDSQGGVFYLLVDDQTRVGADGRTDYRHLASKATSERGLEDIARVSVTFDPSFQTLALHTLKVHRDGRVQDRLPKAQVQLLQRETELEARVYDGSKTANIVLDDVRVGDVVEYAYSLRGNNPVFQQRTFGWLDMQWGSAVAQVEQRLLMPKQRGLQWRTTGETPKQQVSEQGDAVDYRWSIVNQPALHRDSQTPGWYDPLASVAWSEFADWAAVARWAELLYAVPTTLSPELQAEVDHIGAEATSPDQRLLAALRLVQSQIRYLGIEIGPGSHAPRPPALVLQRRYGDCKDKTLLTITLLRALGIPADAALVNTRLRQAAADRLASPGVFNHVIVRATLGQQAIWIDPTQTPQAGDIGQIAQADFGAALVLDGKSSQLTTMPALQASRTERQITQHFDLHAGLSAPVPLTISSEFTGSAADDLRDTLQDRDRAELERDYLNYYARSYAGMQRSSPMTVEDDLAHNRIRTVEHYLLPRFGAPGEDLVGWLRSPDLKHLLADPKETVRTMPLRVDFPQRLSLTVTAQLPPGFRIQEGRDKVATASFELAKDWQFKDNLLQIHYQYASLRDHVPVDQLAQHLTSLDAARDMVGFRLHQPSQAAGKPNARTFDLAVLSAAIVILVTTYWTAGGLRAFALMVRMQDQPDRKLPTNGLIRRVYLSLLQFIVCSALALFIMFKLELLPWQWVLGTALACLLFSRLFWRTFLRRWQPHAANLAEDRAEFEAQARRHRLWQPMPSLAT